jgi:hypothetical protein
LLPLQASQVVREDSFNVFGHTCISFLVVMCSLSCLLLKNSSLRFYEVPMRCTQIPRMLITFCGARASVFITPTCSLYLLASQHLSTGSLPCMCCACVLSDAGLLPGPRYLRRGGESVWRVLSPCYTAFQEGPGP